METGEYVSIHGDPTIEETLQEISSAKVFTKLDLNMAFSQIELHPDSGKSSKTALVHTTFMMTS